MEREFRRYLDCGLLACGFARAYCDGCGHDFLIAFSCQGRAVCPSCNARRMVATAAHLTDHVLPGLPVRQWALAVPKRLRYFLQRDADQVRRRLLRVFVRRRLLPADDAQAMGQWQHGGGFCVDASVRIEATDRAGCLRLLRYCARPPFALDRLRERDREHLIRAARSTSLHRSCRVHLACRPPASIRPGRIPTRFARGAPASRLTPLRLGAAARSHP